MPRIAVQDTPTLTRMLALPTDLPKDTQHRQDGPTQGICAFWGALLAPPHLSAAASTSDSAPRGFGSFLAITSSPGLFLALPGLRARGAVTSEHTTHGRLCLATATSEQKPITYTPRGWSVTPKPS